MADDLEARIIEALRSVALKPGVLRQWFGDDEEPRDTTVGDYLPSCWLNEKTMEHIRADGPDPWTEDFLKRCAMAVKAVVTDLPHSGADPAPLPEGDPPGI